MLKSTNEKNGKKNPPALKDEAPRDRAEHY